eukprot:4554927-Pleurochrysis_carterae.AAC.1
MRGFGRDRRAGLIVGGGEGMLGWRDVFGRAKRFVAACDHLQAYWQTASDFVRETGEPPRW